MILQSLIQDESKLSLDCARATVKKGMIIELPDNLYTNKEVQTAIKIGMLRLVGDPPKVAPEEKANPAEEKKIKLRCNPRVQGRIAFDCIKDGVSAGQILWVPQSKMYHPEIQNALSSGILEDPSGDIQPNRPIHQPVAIEEVRVTEEEARTIVPPQRTPNPRRATRPAQRTASRTARPIRRAGGGSEDDGGRDMEIIGGESEVIVPDRGTFNNFTPNPRTQIPEEEMEITGDSGVVTEEAQLLQQINSAPKTAPAAPPKDLIAKASPPKQVTFFDIFGDN